MNSETLGFPNPAGTAAGDAAGHTWRVLAVPWAELALFPSLAPCLSDGRQIRLNVAGLKSLACRTILTDLESVVKIALARSCLQQRSFTGDQIVFHLQLMNLALTLHMLYTLAKYYAVSWMLISILSRLQLEVGIAAYDTRGLEYLGKSS